MAKILITGSNGFVGTSLSKKLAESGHQICCVDLALPDTKLDSIEYHQGDLTDHQQVDQLLSEGFDGIIHLAAISRAGIARAQPVLCWNHNVHATSSLLQKCVLLLNSPWFILASSREVEYLTPDTPYDIKNTYGYTKKISEELIPLFYPVNTQRACIFRLSDVYGTANDHQGKVLSLFLNKALDHQPITIDNPAHRCFFTHIDDVVSHIVAEVEQIDGRGAFSRSIYKLWSEESVDLVTLARLIIRLTNSRSELSIAQTASGQMGETPAGDLAHYIGLEEGLLRLIREMQRD